MKGFYRSLDRRSKWILIGWLITLLVEWDEVCRSYRFKRKLSMNRRYGKHYATYR